MSVIYLPTAEAQTELELREISGAEATAKTVCTVSRADGELVVRVDAHDDRMSDLIASAPPAEGNDQFLYEEDCVQIAAAAPGMAEAGDFLLVNALGSAKARGGGLAWARATEMSADGWSVEVRLPIPPGSEMLGLSVHRFYRGVHHEGQGIEAALPFPLDTASFAVVILQQEQDIEGTGERYRRLAESAQEAKVSKTVAALKQRIAGRRHVPPPWTGLASGLAEKRAEQPVRPGTGFLCWNEGHYQNALIDLWELTEDDRWLVIAIERMEEVWSMTGEGQVLRDNVWGEVMPTWYDHNDELGTAISLITGVILLPMARLMGLIRANAKLASLWPRVEHWVGRCREAIAVHDREWVDLPDGAGNYLEPFLKGRRRVYPTGGSRPAPLNRAFFLAIPMLYLGRLLDDQTYIDRVGRMARYFRHALQTMENGTVVWEYLVSRYPATGEDISHASCQALFADLCFREGIEFTEIDLRSIAHTFERNIFRYGDVPCEYIRGLDPRLSIAVAMWSDLCRFAPQLFPNVAAVVETAISEGAGSFGHDGWQIRTLTMVEKARKRLELESPEG